MANHISHSETDSVLGLKANNTRYNFYCVDDSSFLLKVIVRMLDDFKGNVLGSTIKSKDALAYIQENSDIIDIVTLDIHMPEMNGIELLHEIKKINPNIKVIMVSAVGDIERVKQTLKLGASHFIVKPFNKDKAFPILKFVCGTVVNG